MSAPESRSAEPVFYAALELPVAERHDFLNEACSLDGDLRSEVTELLRAHDQAAGFLQAEGAVSSQLGSQCARPKSEAVGEQIGPYRLLEQLGEGGFGTVWVAEQERPIRRRVALKIIKLGMDTKDVVARFELERQALALMDHPNIARVLDAGATPLGRPFFVMELVHGVKITDYCDEAALTIAARLQLFIAVCHAVQHAHQKGIIHRDLKPSNILVTLHDGVPVPKVIDFGVAKATEQQRFTDFTIYTQLDQMIGTPLYMSPEQADQGSVDIDTRSDIYSLGVLLYELLTGRTPFDPERIKTAGFDEIRRVIREEEPPTPSTGLSALELSTRTTMAQYRQTDSPHLISQIRGDLDWIVMKALEKDRTRRYETANGLALDIQRHLNSEPVLARPPSAGYRFRRLVRRNKLAVSAGSAVAAALLIGIAVSTWQAFRANAALSELRASAPAFAAMAGTLVAKDEIDDAIEKMDVAIKLRPDLAVYLLTKADLLQSQLRFAEAAPLYRHALRLDPGHPHVESNAALCEKLARQAARQPKLARDSLVELFSAMTSQRRPAAEMMRVGKLVGEENQLILAYWLERLEDLPISPQTPLKTRLTVASRGELALDLSNTEIADLGPLKGMPLGSLNLSRCDKVVDITPLREMPLKTLVLTGTEVVDLEPLRAMKSLNELRLSATKVAHLEPLQGLLLKILDLGRSRVADLTPLRGMPLHTLLLASTPVTDINPLTGMRLRHLDLSATQVSDINPLANMPLVELDCSSIPAQDFSALSGLPIENLSVAASGIRDLSVLEGMPLRRLDVYYTKSARGFEVICRLNLLNELRLPYLYDLTDAEFIAIGSLRDSPSIQSIRADSSDDSLTRDRFWRSFVDVAKGRRVNSEALALCLNGKYPDAVELFREWIGNGSSDWFTHWNTYAVLLAASGDSSGYQEVCKRMVAQFRRRGMGDEVSVRTSLLAPNSGVAMEELRRLMPHVALINPRSPYLCLYVLSNGLLEYRAGRYKEAIELLVTLETDLFPATLGCVGKIRFRTLPARQAIPSRGMSLLICRSGLLPFGRS